MMMIAFGNLSYASFIATIITIIILLLLLLLLFKLIVFLTLTQPSGTDVQREAGNFGSKSFAAVWNTGGGGFLLSYLSQIVIG